MLEKTLSPTALKSLRLSEELAVEFGQYSYSAPHLLWSICNDDLGLEGVFADLKVDRLAIRDWALSRVKEIPKSPKYVAIPKSDESSKAVLQETQKLSIRYGYDQVTPLDILESCFTPGVAFTDDQLRRLPLALYEIIDWRNQNGTAPEANGQSTQESKTNVQNSLAQGSDVLSKYCENINEIGKAGKIDPVLGRDKELKQLVEILGKRISPNVMIVGEPGVGKTSVVGGLVMKILEQTVPDKLKTATIYDLDVSGKLVAGAFKGEVEERLKSILEAIKKTEGKSILFIDEIHILLDEKGPVGSGVVNILKPELSKGEITLIGATTQNEYQKYIEKDSAFSRRFSKLTIDEPDEATTNLMLQGLIQKYEEFHGINIDR
ncbi:MAG: AAA family ATPase, partial [Flavobacteriales bacterium]